MVADTFDFFYVYIHQFSQSTPTIQELQTICQKVSKKIWLSGLVSLAILEVFGFFYQIRHFKNGDFWTRNHLCLTKNSTACPLHCYLLFQTKTCFLEHFLHSFVSNSLHWHYFWSKAEPMSCFILLETHPTVPYFNAVTAFFVLHNSVSALKWNFLYNGFFIGWRLSTIKLSLGSMLSWHLLPNAFLAKDCCLLTTPPYAFAV